MRPEVVRKRRLQKARSEAARRDVWLTDLHCSPAKVHWVLPDGTVRGRVKNGHVLDAPSAFIDRHNRLWVDWPGAASDGASYPSPQAEGWWTRQIGKLLKKVVGDRLLEGVIAAAFKHDRMGRKTLVYWIEEEHRELLVTVFDPRHGQNVMREVISEAKKVYLNLSIVEAARIYAHMLAAWPVDETVSKIQTLRQKLGLIIFQPWYRLILGTGEGRWEVAT
ncbi:MAG: hypothetical protein AAGJ81_10750 [Verrucomicrobiota bacterium]